MIIIYIIFPNKINMIIYYDQLTYFIPALNLIEYEFIIIIYIYCFTKPSRILEIKFLLNTII